MTWKTRFISLGHKMTAYNDRDLLALPLMRHLRLTLLVMVTAVCILFWRLPYLIEQISQQVWHSKDLVAVYSTGDYIREFDHLRVGILEQFDQELRIVDADVFLDDRHDFKDAASLTVRDHLKQEQDRLRQHLANYVRLQSFEEKDLTMAVQELDATQAALEKLLSEILLWIVFFLASIFIISKLALQDLRALFIAGGGADGTGSGVTSSSITEFTKSPLVPMPINRQAAVESNMPPSPTAAARPNLTASSAAVAPTPQAAPATPTLGMNLTEHVTGTVEIEILHQHETYKFFTVNYSDTGLLLSGLELRPQIFQEGEELNGTIKSGEQVIYFKGQVVRVQQERHSFLYGIKFLSMAMAPRPQA